MNQSRLYTFIDQGKKSALYFLEGQKLIQDLVLTHEFSPGGFSCFRSAVLSVQLMLGLLKHGEYFCFYIDSESPYFRLKIEMNTQGLMRGMFYSDDLNVDPETVTGQVRQMKFLPSAEMPYQSIIDLQNVGINEIMNHVLSMSHQTKSRICVSDKSDQSFMLHQLPLTSHEEPVDSDEAFDRYMVPIKEIMSKGLTDHIPILNAFEKEGFKYLASQPVEFKCGCSQKQMIDNIGKLINTTDEDLFLPGEDALEVVCEYCKTAYRITKRDIQQRASSDSH